MMVTGEQIQAARALVRLRQRNLAEVAGVSIETVKRLERTRGEVSATTATVGAIERALKAAGVIFIEENDAGPGVRLRKREGPGRGSATDSALPTAVVSASSADE